MSQFWDKKNIRIIHCFGDSLTAGYGVRLGEGWVDITGRRMSGVNFVNHGVLGAHSSDILTQMSFLVQRAGTGEGFFFMGGTNDILDGIRLDVIEKGIRNHIENMAERVPLTLGIPLLATPYSIETGWEAEYAYEQNQRDLTEFAKFLRNFGARLKIPVIDFAKAIPAEDEWYSDGIHPNRKGYEKMAGAAEKVWR